MIDYYSKPWTEKMNKILELEVMYRKIDYILRGGKGRPRKSDFIILKLKDIEDYKCFEIINNGFSTTSSY